MYNKHGWVLKEKLEYRTKFIISRLILQESTANFALKRTDEVKYAP